MELLPIRRAILSVTDKTGLVELGRFLQDRGVELYSTGGTRKKLLEAGLNVRSVSDVTGFPEIMGGRVKTLHPNIHAGVLADKDNPEHLQTLKELDLAPFDLVCVNLYNFARAVSSAMDLKAAVEQIDIGGPTMIRAAAKNFHSVTVLPDPEFYEPFMKEMEQGDGSVSLKFRKEAAAFTFNMTSTYDGMIAEYLNTNDA